MFQPPGCGADLVEPGGAGNVRRLSEDVLQRAGGLLGGVEVRRRILFPGLVDARDEPVEIASSRGIHGDFAKGSDGDRSPQLFVRLDRRALAVEREPAPVAVRSVERAEVCAASGSGLRWDHCGDDVALLRMPSCELCDPLELVREPHGARIDGVSARTSHAKELFAPLGPTYDRVGAVLSLGQDPLWRRFLVSRLPPGGHVLDVATGTGLVAAELARRGFEVTGLDQSADMLAVARRRFGERIELVEASADAIPFPDASFDHLTCTYLLRYVEDPRATLMELARVVRRGGVVASLEFGVPGGIARPLWELYVGAVLPLAGRALPKGWQEVGRFLGASIRAYWERYPLERQLELWHSAGMRDLQVRRLSVGAAVVMWGRRA
jgi:demethylmenaquinone methyltransferase / 2-methoxy-6-polyprenyl-1,4-benzoquinol methylase